MRVRWNKLGSFMLGADLTGDAMLDEHDALRLSDFFGFTAADQTSLIASIITTAPPILSIRCPGSEPHATLSISGLPDLGVQSSLHWSHDYATSRSSHVDHHQI